VNFDEDRLHSAGVSAKTSMFGRITTKMYELYVLGYGFHESIYRQCANKFNGSSHYECIRGGWCEMSRVSFAVESTPTRAS